MPKVSVILPVYNVEKYIREALDSVVNQTLRDIEIICVDDCSTDNSYEILQEYAQKDSRFIVLKQEVNQGPGVARNRGLDVATGDYIMFLDPDDWYELDACESAYNQIVKNNSDFAIFGHNNYFETTKEWQQDIRSMLKPFEDLDNNYSQIKDLKHDFIKSTYATMLIYNKSFLNANNIRFPKLKVFEDQAFYMHVMICAETLSIIDKPLYNYRINEGSSTYAYSNPHENLLQARLKILDLLNQFCKYDIVKKSIYIHTLESCLYWQKKQIEKRKNIEYDFFNCVKEIFSHLDKKYMKEKIKPLVKRPDYKQYQQIIKQNFYTYSFVNNILKSLIQNIFSVKNEIHNEIKHKVITILGVKIKIRLKRREKHG